MEKLETQRGMGEKVGGRGSCGNIVVSKQHAAAQFQIRNHPCRRGKVRLEVYRIEPCSISILRRLHNVIYRQQDSLLFEIAVHEAAQLNSCKNFAEAHSAV